MLRDGFLATIATLTEVEWQFSAAELEALGLPHDTSCFVKSCFSAPNPGEGSGACCAGVLVVVAPGWVGGRRSEKEGGARSRERERARELSVSTYLIQFPDVDHARHAAAESETAGDLGGRAGAADVQRRSRDDVFRRGVGAGLGRKLVERWWLVDMLQDFHGAWGAGRGGEFGGATSTSSAGVGAVEFHGAAFAGEEKGVAAKGWPSAGATLTESVRTAVTWQDLLAVEEDAFMQDLQTRHRALFTQTVANFLASNISVSDADLHLCLQWCDSAEIDLLPPLSLAHLSASLPLYFADADSAIEPTAMARVDLEGEQVPAGKKAGSVAVGHVREDVAATSSHLMGGERGSGALGINGTGKDVAKNLGFILDALQRQLLPVSRQKHLFLLQVHTPYAPFHTKSLGFVVECSDCRFQELQTRATLMSHLSRSHRPGHAS